MSDEREVFDTGSVREPTTDKPRYDLIPTHALKRVAMRYTMGSAKYGDRNWEKGQPYSRFIESAERHLHQYKQGEVDEDHLAAVVFNILSIIHFQEIGRDELDDLPRYENTSL